MLGLYQQDASDAYDALARQPAAGLPEPGMLSGTLTAIPRGVGSGLTKVAAAAADAHAEVAAGQAQAQGINPDVALIEQQSYEGGYVPQFTAEEREQKVDPQAWLAKQRADTQQVVDTFKPDPVTTGAAGQVLFGLSDAMTRFVAGGPGVAGASEFATRRNELLTQGVDAKTAAEIATMDAGVLAIGGTAPMAYGKTLLQRVGTGILTNEALGAASTASTAKLLNDAGYTEQAKQYNAFDAQSTIANIVLGAAFGLHAHLARVQPSVVDAALTQTDAAHAEATAPGVPVDPVSRSNHIDNLNAAAEALISGGDIPQMKPVETVPNPAQDALQARSTVAVEEAAKEVTGEAPAPPYAGERRADATEQARVRELRQKFVDNDLTPAEKDELLALQERDRLSATVAGRRVAGLKNAIAYDEMLQRGEAQPVQGFADLDMLKTLNDTMGHAIGDDAIRSTGETLTHYFGEGNAFHRSGDEFMLQAKDQATYDKAIGAAKQYLAGHVLRDYDAQGNVVREQRGIGLSHGSGENIASAERAAYADKAARAAAGLRSERGTADRGAVAEKPTAGSGKDAGVEAAGSEAAKLDEPTRQATEQAQQILDRLPDFNITDENGVERPAKDVLADALASVKDAATDAELHTVAAACFGRG